VLAGLAAVLEKKELMKRMRRTTDVRDIIAVLSEVCE
jgi:mannitol/fructose-specific phosphotransferase system IIA component (Ntr-type)